MEHFKEGPRNVFSTGGPNPPSPYPNLGEYTAYRNVCQIHTKPHISQTIIAQTCVFVNFI